MTLSKPQLSTLVLRARHLAAREAVAAFILDAGTAFAGNPFPETSAATVRHHWNGQAFEFRVLGVAAAGLPDLLGAVAALPAAEPLRLEILKAGPHTCCVYLHAGAVLGAVLHGKPGLPLPAFSPPPAPRRRRIPAAQLDLFAEGV